MAARDQLSFAEFFVLTVPVVLIAWISYKFIETPIRENKTSFKVSALKYYALPAIVIIAIGVPLKLSDGELYKYGFGKQLTALDFIDSDKYCAGHYDGDCRIGARVATNHRSVLYGDSHAAQYMPFFDTIGQAQGFSLHAYSGNGCTPVFSNNVLHASTPRPGPDGTCEDVHLVVAQHLKEYDRIYIAAYWKNYLERDKNQFLAGLKETLKYLHQYGAQIILVEDSPAWKNSAIERYLRNQSFHDKVKFSLPFSNHYETYAESKLAEQEIKKLAAELPYVTYLPVIDDLRAAGVELPVSNNVLMYKDTSHLNNQGSHLLAKFYLSKVKKLID